MSKERECELFTIVIAEDEYKDGLQPEEVKEVPGQAGNPSHVQIPSGNARLQH